MAVLQKNVRAAFTRTWIFSPLERKRYTFISENSGWKLGGKPHMNQSSVPAVTRPQAWNHWVLPQSVFSDDFCASSPSSFRRHHSVFEALGPCRRGSRKMAREYCLSSSWGTRLAWETGFASRTSQPSNLGTTLLGCEKVELCPLTKLHTTYQ